MGASSEIVKVSLVHIQRLVGDTRLAYEDILAFLTQVKVVLNLRPLCPLSDDPEDIEALTPGYFLIGAPINAIPHPHSSSCRNRDSVDNSF